jgi:phosphoribosylformimino-5-aminoimidazole carboxamide ribotide isomerase
VLIPCIDLQGGQAVQLVHGRRRELAVADVIGLLDKFKKYPWLHVIDLDAAMSKPGNDRLVHQLCIKARGQFRMKVRVGGGIRSVSRALDIVKSGAEQIIIGSAAFHSGKVDMRFLRLLRKKIDPCQIVIALDTENGYIVTHGWRRALKLRAEDVMAQLAPFCAAFLCTDVDREGTMRGANLEWFRRLRSATSLPIIAAGGIKTRREIDALEKIGMDAAVGMALYKKRVHQRRHPAASHFP